MVGLQELIRRQKTARDPVALYLERLEKFANKEISQTIAAIIAEKEREFGEVVLALREKLVRELELLRREIPDIRRDIIENLKGADGYTPVKGKDFRDGKDADEKAIEERVLARIPTPKDGNDGIDAKPEDVVSLVLPVLLEKIPPSTKEKDADEVVEMVNVAEEKVLQSSVKDLPEALEEIRKEIRRKVVREFGGGGGGVTYRTPSGAVDGSNTSFTAVSSPNFVVADGITYFENNGYTLSGLTITMSVAPSQYIRYA